MRIHQFLAAAALTLLCVVKPASASADVSGAQTFVEREHNQIKKLVENNAANAEIKAVMDGMIDYEELGRRTLGKPCPASIPGCTNWFDKLAPDQQKEITGLIKQLVEKNYLKNMRKTRDYDVTYRSGKEVGENLTKIRTEAKNKTKPRDPSVQVDYVIMSKGDKYWVIDIVTEGSYMAKNYYDQSNKILSNPNQGYSYLAQKYRDKIAKPVVEDSK